MYEINTRCVPMLLVSVIPFQYQDRQSTSLRAMGERRKEKFFFLFFSFCKKKKPLIMTSRDCNTGIYAAACRHTQKEKSSLS